MAKAGRRAQLSNEHWADSHCEPGVKAELKAVQPEMYMTQFIRSLTIQPSTRNFFLFLLKLP